MVREIRVRERERDESLGIIKKEISFPGKESITTPSKSFVAPSRVRLTNLEKLSMLDINEVSRRFDLNTIKSFDVSGTDIIRDIERRYVSNKINFFIPHLRIYEPLELNLIRSLSNLLHTVSDASIVLPTVDSSFLKDYRSPKSKTKIWSRKKINIYTDMIKNILNELKLFVNGKSFIGIIPLIPIGFIRPLLKLYQKEGINSFLIDAGTRDILGASEYEFRMILSEINSKIVPLHNAFIYASNLGYGLFKKEWTLADDFLSLFAYVDVLGSTFKSRGFNPNINRQYVARAKIFSKENYVYNMSSYNEAKKYLNVNDLDRIKLREFNEKEQKIESDKLGDLIGKLNMKDYLLTKKPIKEEPIKFDRLINISSNIKLI